MIVFQLKCSNAHRFEAWFRDGASFDAQSAARKIECPLCADTGVTKAPMAPHVAADGETMERSEKRAREVAEQILKSVDQIRRRVEENCDYVGDKFAEEARRIHYGETGKRGIFGEASDEESSELDEEGIEFQRIPWIPRRTN